MFDHDAWMRTHARGNAECMATLLPVRNPLYTTPSRTRRGTTGPTESRKKPRSVVDQAERQVIALFNVKFHTAATAAPIRFATR